MKNKETIYNNSRTAKAFKNSSVALICQLSYLLVSFICRTIFTYLLGAEYLGINGLFTNILTILSFAELGIGSALVYHMYEPLATGNILKLAAYVKLYRKIYNVIIAVITVLGISIIPFLNYLVQAPQVKESITFLYCLYLLDIIISYIYVYKKSILIADQKDYIVSIYTQIFNVVMNLAQIVFLLLTHNFIIYCLIRTFCSLLNNITCSKIVDKLYPKLKEVSAIELSKQEKNQLKIDVKGLLFTKVASVTFSGTDNLFISSYIGIKYVGILSNYTMLLVVFNGIMNKIFYSVTASIGNLAVTGTPQQMESVLKKMFFLNTSIYGYICIGTILLIKSFVADIWLTEEYSLSEIIIFVMILELFLRSIHYPLYTIRTAMGRFSEYKAWFVIMAIVNILLDFLWIKPFGIIGLFVATILCRTVTYFIDLWVVYHQQWKISILNYIKMIFVWVIFLIIIGIAISKVLNYIIYVGIIGFCLKILTLTLIYWLLFLIVFWHTEEFQYYKQMLYRLFYTKRFV